MDKLKQWVVLAVVAVLVVLAGGWFLLITPKRSEAADIRTQAGQQLSANSVLQTQLSVLKAQAKDLPRQQAKLAAVAVKIPDNPALPSLIRALVKAADSAGIELVSISPSAPTAVAVTTPVVPVAAVPPAGTAAAGKTTVPVTPATAPATAGQLQSIGVSLNVVGGYFELEQFFSGLEDLSRALKVTAFTLAPGSNPLKTSSGSSPDTGKVLTATITSTVYLATGRPAATPAGAR